MKVRKKQFKSGIYSIRQLLEEEAGLYKSMRLEAIQTEPAMFRCTTPAEDTLTDAEWQERIKHPRAVFGVFTQDKLVGMTSILQINKHNAYLGQSYLRPAHRGKGLSSLFYKIRIAWAMDHQMKQLSVSHRESNLISKAANQHFGFQFTHRESCNWLDGTSEDVLYYVLNLDAAVTDDKK